jgi:hypothetical protein
MAHKHGTHTPHGALRSLVKRRVDDSNLVPANRSRQLASNLRGIKEVIWTRISDCYTTTRPLL